MCVPVWVYIENAEPHLVVRIPSSLPAGHADEQVDRQVVDGAALYARKHGGAGFGAHQVEPPDFIVRPPGAGADDGLLRVAEGGGRQQGGGQQDLGGVCGHWNLLRGGCRLTVRLALAEENPQNREITFRPW